MKKYRVTFEDNTKLNRCVRHIDIEASNKQMAYGRFKKTIFGKCSIISIVEKRTLDKSFWLSVVGLIGIVLLCVLLIAAIIKTINLPEPVSYDKYVVQYGDTLWDIAKESNAWNKMDGHQIISDMKKYSRCSSEIHPGEIVYIPQY